MWALVLLLNNSQNEGNTITIDFETEHVRLLSMQFLPFVLLFG
jgi:hypothetical protein